MDTRDQLAGHRFELSKTVLYLSALALLGKLVKADVSAALLGIPAKAEHAAWAIALVALVQTFTVFALHVCILEDLAIRQVSGTLKADANKIISASMPTLIFFHVVKGLGGLVYFLPVLFGTYVAIVVWPETVTALRLIWSAL